MKGVFARAVLAVACAFLLTQCDATQVQRADFFVFGTTVEVELRGVAEDHAQATFAALQQRFQRMHADWHAWEPSEVTDVNSAFAEGRTAQAGPDIIHLIRSSRSLEDRSGGLFNPAIGGLIRLWGFHTSEFPIQGPPPPDSAIKAWLDRSPSMLDVRISGDIVRSQNTAVQLDFGGIAKGYAVDLAMDYIKAQGIEYAMVNAGGDLRVISPPGAEPWRVGIRRPGGTRNEALGGILARTGEAVFTSGNSQRFRQDASERWPHIIDPRTGWPVTDVASVTVIAEEGLLADAGATALMVAGLDDWPRVAARLGLSRVLVVDENGTMWSTTAMRDRLGLSEEDREKLRVVVLTAERS